MNPRRTRAFPGTMLSGLLLAAVLVGTLAPLGCAKRVPLKGGAFTSDQKIVLTLKDGRTVQGKVAPDESILFVDHSKRYRGRIRSVSDSLIVLENLVQIDEAGSYAETASRLADSRIQVNAPIPSISLSRAEVDKVELLTFDPTRSARSFTFWAYGAVLAILLLSEHS